MVTLWCLDSDGRGISAVHAVQSMCALFEASLLTLDSVTTLIDNQSHQVGSFLAPGQSSVVNPYRKVVREHVSSHRVAFLAGGTVPPVYFPLPGAVETSGSPRHATTNKLREKFPALNHGRLCTSDGPKRLADNVERDDATPGNSRRVSTFLPRQPSLQVMRGQLGNSRRSACRVQRAVCCVHSRACVDWCVRVCVFACVLVTAQT